MTGAVVLFVFAVLLGLAAGMELLSGARPSGKNRAEQPRPGAGLGPGLASLWSAIGIAGALPARFGLEARIGRAGMADRLPISVLIGAKLAGALTGLITGMAAAPVAPGRLSILVAAVMPTAGFLAPDAWLERRARARMRSLRAALPDALDLLSVGASAGRSAVAGMAEIGAGEGALASELAVLAAEASCGAPQREVLENLRRRVPITEVAGLCGVIDRSRRYGSPLAEQLREQSSALRAVQRRRVEEHAARAAPKIQLAVALLLVPSVLLMIAAGLLANVDRFLDGL